MEQKKEREASASLSILFLDLYARLIQFTHKF